MTEHTNPTISENVREVRDLLMHFISKATNSNARYVGIRVGRDRALRLPYVSARCLVARGGLNRYTIPMGGPNSIVLEVAQGKSYAEALAVEQEKADKSLQDAEIKRIQKEQGRKLSRQEKDQIRQTLVADISQTKGAYRLSEAECAYLADAEAASAFVGVDMPIDARMRQILIPDGKGGYINAVPLQNMPMVDKARETVWTLYHSNPEQYRVLPTIDYPVGGEKYWNVGLGLGYRRFLLTGFYRRNTSASVRASVLRRGVAERLSMDIETLALYQDFIAKCRWSTHEMAAHKGYVRRIVQHFYEQAEQMANTLSAEDIDGLESSLDRGLLDPSCRGPSWKKEFARWVHGRMKNQMLSSKDGQPQYLFGANDTFLRKVLAEVVS